MALRTHFEQTKIGCPGIAEFTVQRTKALFDHITGLRQISVAFGLCFRQRAVAVGFAQCRPTTDALPDVGGFPQWEAVDVFGNHGLGGLLEEGAHEKSPKCPSGNLGDFGGILQRSLEVYLCMACHTVMPYRAFIKIKIAANRMAGFQRFLHGIT